MRIKYISSYNLPSLLNNDITKLNREGKKDIELEPCDMDGILPSADEDQNEVRIYLIDRYDTNRLYAALASFSTTHAITVIDNGSSKGLEDFVDGNRLTTRLLAAQSHAYMPQVHSATHKTVTRLSELRADSDLSEIVLRTSDIALFNINAIRRSDQLGSIASQTTGLTIEEACLIGKFIGASDLIRDIYITGFDLADDPYAMMSGNVANILWYIEEGLLLRDIESDFDSVENLVFNVMPEGVDMELEFVKSKSTGRWWVKVPTEDGDMHMACTQEDYNQACQNTITDRISNAFSTV